MFDVILDGVMVILMLFFNIFIDGRFFLELMEVVNMDLFVIIIYLI